jgi:gamma-D-glutamyl-L-lysine dipeptidyl-peptidase
VSEAELDGRDPIGEQLRVKVDVATVWTSPEAPRDIDGPAVADVPDVAGWVAGLDPQGRLGLHGRTLTQLLADEPVEVVEEQGDWVRVAAPWQPMPEDDRGYLGWVRRAHLRPPRATDPDTPPANLLPDRAAIASLGVRFIGLRYLWGGTSPAGLDCSGLVHLCYREAGVVIPRDAYAQAAAATPVPVGDEQPGDLYFFARDDGRVFHVGFVTGRHRMLHAPEDASTGGTGAIEDAPLAADRIATLVAAGRFLD